MTNNCSMQATISALIPTLTKWRHHLHQNPESAFEEHSTAQFVADKLTQMGLQVHTGIGKTGVVGVLKKGTGTKTIAIRADMDCIEMSEQGDVPYKSTTPNHMHGCGHDGHTVMALGAAQVLSECEFDGTVVFVFQPAEENGKGAKAMLADGLEKFNIDEMYGLHNMPAMAVGTIATRQGGIMASEDNFVIKIKGQGSHAARPHTAKDPLVTAAEIIVALQTIISRNLDLATPAVISCTELHTDGIRNAIPSTVIIKGDTRSYEQQTSQLIEQRMHAIASHICAMNDCECEFSYTHEFAPTVNHANETEFAIQSAKKVVGDDKVNGNIAPMMISEDFGAFLEVFKGAFVFIGNGSEQDGKGYLPLHNACYDFNDDCIAVGVGFFVQVVMDRLG